MTEPSLKRQRAESDVNPPVTAKSSTTTITNIPDENLYTALEGLDKSPSKNTFSQHMLVKLAVRDLRSQPKSDKKKAERKQHKDFSYCVDALKDAILDEEASSVDDEASSVDEEASSAHLPRDAGRIARCFVTKMREIKTQTHLYSSFETKRSALDTLRRMGFTLLNHTNEEMQQLFPGAITTGESDEYCLEIIQIVESMSAQERKDLALMPVDGATVATTGLVGRGGNRYADTMLELYERLNETEFLSAYHLSLFNDSLFESDESDDGSEGEDSSEDE
ncbi:uncharacterized protein J4E92_001439 [Alternaria infectoria]|uniref:uncharacterized protein n=1 Tax=Alternaria infectoria TaxID=45303 RepID=UPI00221EA327|nr:uncharacterized protein J4E92_001439 [Alternaria infectoria]KAI4936715.1 hypothetical protein J4E92_001439 [Alternaria infectoria]